MERHLYQGWGRVGVDFVFRASFTKNGVTYFAKDYGYRAFRIPLRRR